MDQAARHALAEKLMKLRRLELRGATQGEKAAARAAFDRVAGPHLPLDQARAEIDGLISHAERPTPRPQHGPPQQPVVFVVSFGGGWTSTGNASTTSGWGW